MEPSRDRRLPEIPVPVQDQGSHRRPVMSFRQDAHCFEIVRIVHIEAAIQQLVVLDRYAVEQCSNGGTIVGRLSRKCRTGFRFIATFRDVERRLRAQEHDVVANREMDFLTRNEAFDLRARQIDQCRFVPDVFDDRVVDDAPTGIGDRSFHSPVRRRSTLRPVVVPELGLDAEWFR